MSADGGYLIVVDSVYQRNEPATFHSLLQGQIGYVS